ncbi:glycoside hydrolase family 3 N-terminal domain-containing protein [Silicimonas sp. MF1-12-2]|uniref:glycoside hydrolase family 3 N-terminal domain-containing protein n=1 Tax=Silicimonas sp. MF1-12-2 TaxID=3384793 RepID=UPI0039B51C50
MGQGAYIFAPSGPTLTSREAAFFREAAPWGFIIFQRNCENPEQLRQLTGDLRAAVGREAPVLIDQEGGRVQRMRAPHWREWLPPLDQVAQTGSARAMYLRGLLIGAELVAHGIDVNCAPSGDIAWPETHPFLRNRCYGTDAATVVSMARACAEGLMDAGCLPVIKHAPGHGRATVDSHKGLPRIDVPLADLRDTDFAPFRALADLPMVMTAHIVLPEIDPEVPLTLSPAGIRYLREELGLKGLLMTDDISMGALRGSVAERGAAALAAGCDLVLHCNGDPDEMELLADTMGQMTQDAAERADIALSCRRTPTDIDIPTLEAEFASLTGGADNA